MASLGLKAMSRAKTPKFGHYVGEFATPGIGHILKSAGSDFVFFDMEHSGFGIETLKSTLRYFQAADLPAMVRIPSQLPNHIARAMDMGVEGLICPMVSNPEQVRRISDAMKYYPAGMRGVAVQIAHDDYRPGTVADKFSYANERSAFICLLETAEGVETIHEMAAMDEIDIVWIGHYDLSVSLGIPGEFGNKVFLKAIDRVMDACLRNNKSVGRMVNSVAQGQQLNADGCDFIVYSGDVWVLHDALATALKGLREACGDGPAAASKKAGKKAEKGGKAKKGKRNG